MVDKTKLPRHKRLFLEAVSPGHVVPNIAFMGDSQKASGFTFAQKLA
jgi:hypothetical protein